VNPADSTAIVTARRGETSSKGQQILNGDALGTRTTALCENIALLVLMHRAANRQGLQIYSWGCEGLQSCIHGATKGCSRQQFGTQVSFTLGQLIRQHHAWELGSATQKYCGAPHEVQQLCTGAAHEVQQLCTGTPHEVQQLCTGYP
jgi:hypothetical protein